MPQLMEAVVEVTPQERVQNRTQEQIVDVPVPPLLEAVVEVTTQERVLNRTHEQISGVPVPQIMEAPVDVMLTTPLERVQNRTPEQIVDVPCPHFAWWCQCLRLLGKSWRGLKFWSVSLNVLGCLSLGTEDEEEVESGRLVLGRGC